jgi:hypothetical protein
MYFPFARATRVGRKFYLNEVLRASIKRHRIAALPLSPSSHISFKSTELAERRE